MSRSQATVEHLLRLLPEMEELEVLRLRMIASAVPDPSKAWDSSSDYATIDKRILTPEDVERSLDAAAEALRQYVSLLHDGLRPVFQSFFRDDMEGAARHLISLGERQEGDGRTRGARESYEAALQLALPLSDKTIQILTLRRLGRVMLSLGEINDATAHYGRSAQLARDSGDLHAEIMARTGAGNAFMYQGRWTRAEALYSEALQLADSAAEKFRIERGQLFNNLGNLATRLNRPDEADAWLAQAREVWESIDSPMDHAVCLINLGHLRQQQARTDDARRAYETALALPVSPSVKALVAADVAEVLLSQGYVARAEELARVSEEHGIKSGSPYTLGYMYRSLGNLARAGGNDDGFTFFEKALQIAREKGYPSLEAETLADYAELRRGAGGVEEAEAYLDRARELFVELGSPQNLARVERALEEIRAERGVLEVPRETPVAAAVD